MARLAFARFSVVSCLFLFACTGTDSPSLVLEDGFGQPDSVADTQAGDAPHDGCVPSCVYRNCGDDGCGGTCGQCDAVHDCVSGRCTAVPCGTKPLTVQGALSTSLGTVTFNHTTVALYHRQSADAQGGCIYEADIALSSATGCSATIHAGNILNGSDLAVQDVVLTVDAGCPGFPASGYGSYSGNADLKLETLTLATTKVPDKNSPTSCFSSQVALSLSGQLVAPNLAQPLLVTLSKVTIAGEFVSVGSTTAACPCQPSCLGRDCGDDGCGGSCGSCTAPAQCAGDGTCVCPNCPCQPECAGKECGPDGCEGLCGSCANGLTCNEASGLCTVCSPQCAGRECGANGCGGVCGTCLAPLTCSPQGQCQCIPQCGGRQCGSDGCGGSCGNCTSPATCTASGTCTCTPNCVGRECGSDGCSATCGTCSGGASCLQGQCQVCAPACNGKTCGPDGCGGQCGTCADAAKPVCTSSGTCVASSCTLPTTWSKIGVVATLQTPGDAAGVALCPDFSGDGKGDNGLKALASTINPELTKAIPSSIAIILEFVGLANPTADTSSFKLVVLTGQPTSAGATTYTIDPSSFDLATPYGECRPLVYFDGAKISAKHLSAGPSLFVLTFPVASLGGNITLTLQDTQLGTTLVDGTVAATGGIASGILTKDQVDVILANLTTTCAAPNPPSMCSYLGTAKAFLPMLFDLDQNKDGKKDAASICMDFTLAGGSITGISTGGGGATCSCRAGLEPVGVAPGCWVLLALVLGLFARVRRPSGAKSMP